jgi:hypothetical protein
MHSARRPFRWILRNNATDENLSFNYFVVAFQGLLGTAAEPTQAQMAFTGFALQV